MKRILCIMVLVCLVFGAAFAQQKTAASAAAGKKNAIGLDVFDLLEGLIGSDSDMDYTDFRVHVGYEGLIAPHFSIGADADAHFMKTGKVDSFYLAIAAEGRYYTMSTGLDKFFLGTTVGFTMLSIDGSTKAGFQGLLVSLKVGYKLVLSGMYLEPALSYVTSEGLGTMWNAGMRLGFFSNLMFT
jgi:hypothetical protein